MSDDIPIIFTEELCRKDRAVQPSAVFLSAATSAQMQQYATGGWKVFTVPGFKSPAEMTLAEVPAVEMQEDAIPSCTLLSCEAPFLSPHVAACVDRWRPAFVKLNCAFYDVADASVLARTVSGLGYRAMIAIWRDDNSFGYRSVMNLGPLEAFPSLEWDRTNLIGVRDPAMVNTLLAVARLYVGEERRIADLRVANEIRNDYIARLEDALMAHQKPAAS